MQATRKHAPSRQAGLRAKIHAMMDDARKAEISARIKEARVQAGLTQPELAEALDPRPTLRTVQNWESGIVPWRRLDEIAIALDVTKTWLLYGEQTNGTEAPVDIGELLAGLGEMREEISRILRLLEGGAGTGDPGE